MPHVQDDLRSCGSNIKAPACNNWMPLSHPEFRLFWFSPSQAAADKIQGVGNFSTLRKLKLAGEFASRGARRNRLISAGWNATRLSARHTARVLRKLWLEVTGFVFLAFAALGAAAGYRAYQSYLTHAPNSGQRLLAACLFCVVFAWFGVSSMWLSRRAPSSSQKMTGAKMTGPKK